MVKKFILLIYIISFVFSEELPRLFPRDDDSDFEQCRSQTKWENDILARFTGIFFGDFNTINSQDILGSLAVKGTFSAPNYVVNANHGANCSDLNSFNSYALVVGGAVSTFNTQIHGSAFINGGGNIDEIKQLEAGCIVSDSLGTGLFDFNAVEMALIGTSQDFANYPPTAILLNDGTLTELRDNELDHYEVITFHTCTQAICSFHSDLESQGDAMLLGSGNWNGVTKSTTDSTKTFVFNVPVMNGATIIVDTNNPSAGLNPCKVIYNFYPVNEYGEYLPYGEFTLLRKTGSQLGGFTLAPRGHIIDGSTGNFAGNIVGLSYLWENANSGVEIHDYKAAGGNCDQYHGCIPVHVTTTPVPFDPRIFVGILSSSTFTIPTESSSIVSYTSISVPSEAISTSTFSPCPTVDVSTETTTDTMTNTVTLTKPEGTVTSFVADSIVTITETETEVHTTTEKTITTSTETDSTETVTLVLLKPTTEISAVVTLTSTDTTLVVQSICSKTGATFTTLTTTIGYSDIPVSTTTVEECAFKKSKHYHKGSDKECYEDHDNADDDDDDDDDDEKKKREN
ncbi:hypothetical protein [Parasitella parasitica]|uniref:Choice-of-anchor A domain-containing protein n=1 Tax=Parasitella parasitica TaxID=35722 RepID=A0A0B7N5A1_9FUNG|nr:hypothetical protein [Parasitella parasitica]